MKWRSKVPTKIPASPFQGGSLDIAGGGAFDKGAMGIMTEPCGTELYFFCESDRSVLLFIASSFSYTQCLLCGIFC